MKTRHSQLLLILVSLSAACNNPQSSEQSSPKSDSIAAIDPPKSANPDTTITANRSPADTLEEKIIDTIATLPEVKAYEKHMKEVSKNHLVIWTTGRPSAAEKCYTIHVGEDNGDNLVTNYQFLVYPDSMRIMYYDVVDDQEITLEQWRKKEK